MSAPECCDCRFCGESFGPDGITNHETWCDENPNRGTPVEKQKELGILEASDEPSDVEAPSPSAADPDQRVASTDGGELPPRDKLAAVDKTTGDGPSGCKNCGSDDVIPAHEARKGFKHELGELPDELRATLDAVEKYCNDCWHVYGGELDEAYAICEEAA